MLWVHIHLYLVECCYTTMYLIRQSIKDEHNTCYHPCVTIYKKWKRKHKHGYHKGAAKQKEPRNEPKMRFIMISRPPAIVTAHKVVVVSVVATQDCWIDSALRVIG
jgi:hypothetical protein